jgi:pescadillo protein
MRACRQVVDRPAQGHVYLGRAYVQPQWALDAANWRVLPDAALYAPGRAPPPHLSPFANMDDDDEGYVPDYARTLAALQVTLAPDPMPTAFLVAALCTRFNLLKRALA